MTLKGYERTLALGNLALFLDELAAGERIGDPRCSRCGDGVPVCADLGSFHDWHDIACRGFRTDMPLCWACDMEMERMDAIDKLIRRYERVERELERDDEFEKAQMLREVIGDLREIHA